MKRPERNAQTSNLASSNGQSEDALDNGHNRDTSLRSQQINDYEQRACQSIDPRARAIGAINSGLMRIGTELEGALITAMKEKQMTLDQIPQTSEAFNMHLRYARMIERLARLEHQFETPNKMSKE